MWQQGDHSVQDLVEQGNIVQLDKRLQSDWVPSCGGGPTEGQYVLACGYSSFFSELLLWDQTEKVEGLK